MRIERITDKITLICGDCMEYMATLGDRAFDIVVCDPPYGLKKRTRSGQGKLKGRILNESETKFNRWDIAPTTDYFNEIRRVSRNQVIWGVITLTSLQQEE